MWLWLAPASPASQPPTTLPREVGGEAAGLGAWIWIGVRLAAAGWCALGLLMGLDALPWT